MSALPKAEAETMTVKQIIGANLRRIRKEKGIRQNDLGELAGVHGSWIGQIELGRVDVRVATLASIARSLDVGIDELLVGVDVAALDTPEHTPPAANS